MKKIVFAMIEAGGGHKAPAKAVMEALEESFPGRYETRMMDFIKDVGSVRVDAAHKKSWKTMLEYPTLTYILYQLQDALGPITRGFYYRTMVAPAVHDTMRFLKKHRPDVVFSSHYFVTMALVEARKRTRLDFQIITYQTEIFTFHAPWKVPETDWYVTASDRAAQSAAMRGITSRKIVKSKASSTQPTHAARKEAHCRRVGCFHQGSCAVVVMPPLVAHERIAMQ